MAYILYASTYISLNYFCHLPLANIFELIAHRKSVCFNRVEKFKQFFRQKTTSVKTTNKRATCAAALKWNPNPKAESKSKN